MQLNAFLILQSLTKIITVLGFITYQAIRPDRYECNEHLHALRITDPILTQDTLKETTPWREKLTDPFASFVTPIAALSFTEARMVRLPWKEIRNIP
jgi:hypothetical protein